MGDLDSPLSEFEEKCCQEVDRESDVENRLQTTTADAEERVWIAFQEAATAVTNLCRERFSRSADVGLWTPFQETAATVGNLFRESASACRTTTEAARLCGYRQRNREILDWAQQKRRLIRREDLIAMLVGRVAPEHAQLPLALHSSPQSGMHARSSAPCPSSGSSCANATATSASHFPPFVDALPRSDEMPSAGRRRIGSGMVDDDQLWESFRLSSRKRPPSLCDNLADSPKRPRFV